MTRRELNEARWGARLTAQHRTKVWLLPHPAGARHNAVSTVRDGV